VQTRGNTLLNAVRAARFVMLERGYRYWLSWWLRASIQKGFSDEVAEYAQANEEAPDSPAGPNIGSSLPSPTSKMRPGRFEADENDMAEATQPVFKGQWKKLYDSSMSAILQADKKRMNRMAKGIDSDEDSDHVPSDDELENNLVCSEAGSLGVVVAYTAMLKSGEKKDKWLRAFHRMYSAWHISEIARTSWAFGWWKSFRLREQNMNRGKELTSTKEKLTEAEEGLQDLDEKFGEFRVGRVGTYIVNDRDDLVEDHGIDDDYSQLVAYTRRMNQNWTRERLMRGISAAGWVLGRSFFNHLCAIFYTWRQNTNKLKLLTQKFNLAELDKMELQAEATQAVDSLDEQQNSNKDLEDMVGRLKRELAKLRREKAWIERYAGQK